MSPTGKQDVMVDSGFYAGPDGTPVIMGDVAHRLAANRMDVNCLRPYALQANADGAPCGPTYIAQWDSKKQNADKTFGAFVNRRVLANATLLRDEYLEIDSAVLNAAEDELTVVKDLMGRGLVYDLRGKGLGKLVLEYQDASDVNDAEVSMFGETRGNNDLVDYQLKYLPLPIIYSEFFFNVRHLMSARSEGRAMDTDMAERKSRKVAQKIEDITLNGLSAFAYGGGTIRGFTDHPNRNLGTLRGAWDDSSTTGEMIVDDVRDMINACRMDKKFGPFAIYYPTAYNFKMGDDYRAAGDNRTIRERVMQTDPELAIFKAADRLTGDNVVCVSLRKETIRMVMGLNLQTIEWTSNDGWGFHFKIVTINVPQVRADQDGKCGVAHYSI